MNMADHLATAEIMLSSNENETTTTMNTCKYITVITIISERYDITQLLSSIIYINNSN